MKLEITKEELEIGVNTKRKEDVICSFCKKKLNSSIEVLEGEL